MTPRLHGDALSGNCFKVMLALQQLGQDYDFVPVDILAGETRSPGFLALNPAGQVPLLELGPGRCLPESNAILLHLAEGTPLLPHDPWQRAQVYRWLFWEQYQHEPAVAVARFIVRWLGSPPDQAARLQACRERGARVLALLDQHLAAGGFVAGPSYTVADIALCAYTRVAPEGGIPLEPYPAVRGWLGRVEAQPGFAQALARQAALLQPLQAERLDHSRSSRG